MLKSCNPVMKSIPENLLQPCESCAHSKSHKLPFPSSTTTYAESFDLVHSDVWGPSPVLSRLGYKYFLLFIDHATRYTWVFFIRNKSDVPMMIRNFVTFVETQFCKTIKIFRSDSGGEYTQTSLLEFFRAKGILTQRTCPHTPEQNGVVERKN